MMAGKKAKNISTIIIAAVVVLSALSGCSNNSRDNPDGDNSDGSSSGMNFIPPEYIYLSEVIQFPALPRNLPNLGIVTLADNAVYFSAWGDGNHEIHFDENWNASRHFNVHGLFSMNADGTDFAELPDYIAASYPPDDANGQVEIKALHVDNEGYLWVVESLTLHEYDIPDDFDITNIDDFNKLHTDYLVTETFNLLRKLDRTGSEIASFDLSDLTANNNWFNVSALSIDNAGNVYIAFSSEITVLDNQGMLIFSLDDPEYLTRFVRLSDGTVAISVWLGNSMHLRRIDVERKSWGETMNLSPHIPGVQSVFSGNEEYLVLFNDRAYLNGIIAETGERVQIIGWSDSALSPEGVIDVKLLPDGRITIIRQLQPQTIGHRAGIELVLLTGIPYDELPERKILTYGTFGYDGNRRYVVEQFNRNSLTHRIHVIDYSLYNTAEDSTAGLFRLTTEIITGNAPDILDIQGIPFQTLVSRDVLIDLYPFLDADPEINRDNMIDSVIKALEINGSLYRVVPSFSLGTIYGHPSVLGSYPGWNMEEFAAVLGANPQADVPAGYWTSNIWFLSTIFMYSMEEYIDRVSGTADFENDSFVSLLELANTFPSEFNYDTFVSQIELFVTGRQIMDMGSIGSLFLLQSFLTVFDGEIVFKGFPTENRDGNNFRPFSSLAVTRTCSDPDAAWEFVRMFFTEDYQRDILPEWTLPVNKAVFEDRLKAAMTPPGAWLIVGDREFDRIEIRGLSQNDVDMFRDTVNNITRLSCFDEILWSIISETATDYFNGRHTAQDAARIIQSRVIIYLSEQS
jgi:ABC-type glycerol-3-phosphate transport system substrate-binding protein